MRFFRVFLHSLWKMILFEGNHRRTCLKFQPKKTKLGPVFIHCCECEKLEEIWLQEDFR